MSTSYGGRRGGPAADRGEGAGPASEPSETELLAGIASAERLLFRAVSRYAGYCQRSLCQERALPRIRALADFVESDALRAECLLMLGSLTEQTDAYEAAIAAYAEGEALAPDNPEVAYYLSNNLGYCLNQLGAHARAEAHCRRAIRILPARHNAHKNLGVALEGQGRLDEAVHCYLDAVEIGPGDRRALDHLEALLARTPTLLERMPVLRWRLGRAREAVAAAASPRPN